MGAPPPPIFPWSRHPRLNKGRADVTLTTLSLSPSLSVILCWPRSRCLSGCDRASRTCSFITCFSSTGRLTARWWRRNERRRPTQRRPRLITRPVSVQHAASTTHSARKQTRLTGQLIFVGLILLSHFSVLMFFSVSVFLSFYFSLAFLLGTSDLILLPTSAVCKCLNFSWFFWFPKPQH